MNRQPRVKIARALLVLLVPATALVAREPQTSPPETKSVPARDAVIAWRLQHGAADKSGYWWSLPVVAETWDGWLNDINGFHVTPNDVAHALDTAKGGPVAEGSVGGGTGMICYEFKGGTGTASRLLDKKDGGYVIGVLVQANCGRRAPLTIAGVPLGKEITENARFTPETGSIIHAIPTAS